MKNQFSSAAALNDAELRSMRYPAPDTSLLQRRILDQAQSVPQQSTLTSKRLFDRFKSSSLISALTQLNAGQLSAAMSVASVLLVSALVISFGPQVGERNTATALANIGSAMDAEFEFQDSILLNGELLFEEL